jgi:hypothetical protein
MKKSILTLPMLSLVLGAHMANAYTPPKPLSSFTRTILLTDAAINSSNNSSAFASSLLAVDPGTGARTVFSDLTQSAQGPTEGVAPIGIVVWPNP